MVSMVEMVSSRFAERPVSDNRIESNRGHAYQSLIHVHTQVNRQTTHVHPREIEIKTQTLSTQFVWRNTECIRHKRIAE